MKAGTIEFEAVEAARIVAEGGSIIYPTDTIWGIGCDALNDEAVQNIYSLKKRSDSKSMLVLMHSVEMLNDYLETIPDQAYELLENADRPTTIIYPGARNFAPGLVAADGSIGIRICSDPFCTMLIEMMEVPLVSTSANISGEAPAVFFQDISKEIKKGVDHIVNWRREDRHETLPSRIIKLEKDGSSIVIRA